MDSPLVLAGVVVIGYLIGSVPTANIMMHLFRHEDLRRVGTGNVTSTAVWIHAGRRAGILSLLGEILKTFLCLFLAYLLADQLWAYLVMLVSAVVGQIWSVWLRGAGGRGQTMFVTGFLVLCPVPFLVAVLCFAGALFATRRFNLSNQIFHLVTPLTLLLALFINPLPFGLDYHSWAYAVVGLIFCGLFFLKHRTERDDIIQTQAWGSYSR
ncbi:MAG: glycerol-3-phosphate acyltransferase [Chloroflexi bacterium]|nr:glycerol-3-phosphate acyltransferase [Chloroflexota bacterium]